MLDATEQLFLEVGVEAITTNHIARRAGVDIKSVYYFFRDKFQIFEAIVGRALDVLRDEIESLETDTEAADSAEQWIDRLVDAHWRLAERWAAASRLFIALRGRPEMESLVRDYDEHVLHVYVAGLKRYCPGIPGRDRRTVAHVLNVTLGDLLNNALENPSVRERNAIVREARILLRGYVSADRSDPPGGVEP